MKLMFSDKIYIDVVEVTRIYLNGVIVYTNNKMVADEPVVYDSSNIKVEFE